MSELRLTRAAGDRRLYTLDGAGTLRLTGRAIRGGGTLRWSGRDLDLRREGALRARHVLLDGGRELARIEVKASGRRPGRVTVDDTAAIEPGLLLFAVFVARALEAAVAAAAS